MANKYQVHVKKFDHDTAEDVLLWYNTVQEIIKQKACKDDQQSSSMRCRSTYVWVLLRKVIQ